MTTSRTTDTRFSGGLTLAVIVAVIGFLAISGVVDGHGRQPWERVGPLPKGVAELSPSSYIVSKGVAISTVCHGRPAGTDGGAVQTIHTISNFGGRSYVECAQDQSWGHSASEPPSNDYSDAMATVGTNLIWWEAVVGFTLVCLLPAGVSYRRDLVRHRAELRAQEKEKEHKRDALEEQRAALATAFAKDEISAETFDKKLGELME